MPVPSRRFIRALLASLVVAALGVVGVALTRHGTQRAVIPPVDAWSAKGVHYAQYVDGIGTVRVAADEITLAPVRAGAFSIGFLQRLEAHNATVTIDLRDVRPDRGWEFDLRAAVAALAGPTGTRTKRLAGAHVAGLVLRLARDDVTALELRAGECEAGALSRGRVMLGDGVRLLADEADLEFSSLTYDIGMRRFVAASVRRENTSIAREAAERTALEAANTAILHLTAITEPTSSREP